MVRTRIRESETAEMPREDPPATRAPDPIEEPYASILRGVIQDLDIQLAEANDRAPARRRWWHRHERLSEPVSAD